MLAAFRIYRFNASKLRCVNDKTFEVHFEIGLMYLPERMMGVKHP